MTPKGYLKAEGRLIHEENLFSKISCQTPFKRMRTNKKLSIGFCMVKQKIFHLLSHIMCMNTKICAVNPYILLCR